MVRTVGVEWVEEGLEAAVLAVAAEASMAVAVQAVAASAVVGFGCNASVRGSNK